jgi:hypothetical protein
MPSIVLELQRLAAESSVNVAELLRKALIVATKLKIEDFRTWVSDELNGYETKKVPDYRLLRGLAVAEHQYRGTTQIQFADGETRNLCSLVPIEANAAELEQYVRASSSMHVFHAPEFHDDFQRLLPASMRNPHVIIPASAIGGIIDRVRSTILQWALKLEEEGILGEGMTFSNEEKEKAARSQSIHIHSFTGVLGDVSGKNVQIGDYGSIHQHLKDAGVSQAERNELENILDALKKAKPDEKPSLVQRGMDWVGRNKEALGTLASVIKGWFG